MMSPCLQLYGGQKKDQRVYVRYFERDRRCPWNALVEVRTRERMFGRRLSHTNTVKRKLGAEFSL